MQEACQSLQGESEAASTESHSFRRHAEISLLQIQQRAFLRVLDIKQQARRFALRGRLLNARCNTPAQVAVIAEGTLFCALFCGRNLTWYAIC